MLSTLNSTMTNGAHMSSERTADSAGFTLVEIMIVVAIIGLLAALALPSFAKARRDARVSAQMNDLRILEDAFQLYAMENRGFPAPTWMPKLLPPGMDKYIRGDIWRQTSPSGGLYAWKRTTSVNGVTRYYISISGAVDQEVWDIMDRKIDDGLADSGKLQWGGADHACFLEQ